MNTNKVKKQIEKIRKKANKSRIINKDILKMSVFFSILFFALIFWLIYFTGFRSSAVLNNSYNKRSDELKQVVVRGNIYSSNGELLAYTECDEAGGEKRIYPYGNIASHIVGFQEHGGLGLESSYNYHLLNSNINIFDKIKNEFNSVKNPGDSLCLTLDIGLQTFISQLLDGAGDSAAVALNPETGEILAMVSKPDFDPDSINENWDSLVNDENSSVLLNRAAQGLYAPGSTFKIFTLYEYMKEHPEDYSGYHYFCEGSLDVQGAKMNCFEYTAHGDENLMQSLAYSCNCSFSNIGLGIDLVKFESTLNSLLFNTDLPIDLPANKSSYVMKPDASVAEIMQTSIGQGRTLCTPLHLACIMSAIANDGVLMKPHNVSKIINDNGNIVTEYKPEIYGACFSAGEASVLREYLEDVICEGTAAWVFSDSFYDLYGKTGTAETVSNFNVDAESADHSWFAGCAEYNGKKVVLCLIIEKAQDTWGSAAQFSKEIFDYCFIN